MTKRLNFSILFISNTNGHVWLVADLLDSNFRKMDAQHTHLLKDKFPKHKAKAK